MPSSGMHKFRLNRSPQKAEPEETFSQASYPRRHLDGGEPLQAWLYMRLYNLNTVDHNKYEASFGGPHNSFLHNYFPPTQDFMVKPIPRLQTPVSDKTPHGTRTSTDSYGLQVERRRDDKIPDFIVCKATGNLDADKPLLMWELKRNEADHGNSMVQLGRYAEWIASYRKVEERIRGRAAPIIHLVLIEKAAVHAVTIEGKQFINATKLHLFSTALHDSLKAIVVNAASTHPWEAAPQGAA